MKTVMPTYKAVVHGGKAVVENLDYEDGTEVELEVVNDNNVDDMNDEERERLHAAIDQGIEEMDAGNTIPAEDIIARLRARHA